MSTLYNHRPHAFQLTGHDTPVLSPVRVSLELVLFDQSPSLHPLRDGGLSRLVQRLRRYYDSVRLPMFVHRQITSLDLLTRSARHLADKHRLSRFSRRGRWSLTLPGLPIWPSPSYYGVGTLE